MSTLFNYRLMRDGVPVKDQEIHLPGPLSPDVALCGHDLCGDSTLGYDSASQTSLKANCPSCIAIVEFAKQISQRNYKKI